MWMVCMVAVSTINLKWCPRAVTVVVCCLRPGLSFLGPYYDSPFTRLRRCSSSKQQLLLPQGCVWKHNTLCRGANDQLLTLAIAESQTSIP